MSLLIYILSLRKELAKLPLHSNMSLLIWTLYLLCNPADEALHSNMSLLISVERYSKSAGRIYFTFQYVSINILLDTQTVSVVLDFTFQYVSINIWN